MGNCKSKPSAANATTSSTNGLVATYLKPPSKLPPFTASTDLFLELGIPLLGRPSPNELLQLFHEHDADHNDVLDVTVVHLFLQAVSTTYGNGSWGKISGSSPSRKNLPSNALLGDNNVLTWDEVRSALWDRPVFGVPSPIVLLFREEFRKRLPQDGRTSALTRVEASKLARRLLMAAHVTKNDANAVSKYLLDAPSVSAVGNGKASSAASEGNQVTLEDFVASVGPAYTALSPNHNAFVGLEDVDIDGNLPLATKIRSFAPVRDDISVEILNCGEAIMRSILHAVDEATTEICMSWFDFVHDLPAVRSESFGANAWSNESGTLPSLLRQKASKGVKVYIMLWNSLDLVSPTAPLVKHAIRNLSKLHPNITVVSHPGMNVWTHAHHQKFVVVDRRVAIVGGLDWNRSEDAAKPWQDVAVWMKGDAAADVALNFIQRWQWARQDTVEVFDGLRNDMPEIPMQIRFLRRPNPDAEAVDDKTRKILTPGGLPSPNVLNKKCKCQIVRSLGQWSAGFSPSEISHYEAWMSAISEAKNYIYIESQCFISNMGEGAAHNRIAEAILLRALQAIEEGRPFHIYCVIPTSVAAEPVTYYTRRTLMQDGRGRGGEACLMSRIGVLLKVARPGTFWHGKSPESMLSVCTLFSADKSESGSWEVGEIFVHSKVLVVDDQVAIIGSANINDRSMVGYSDSELGAIIWDDGNGTVRDFRLRLWRRYLGLPLDGNADDLVAEPATDATFETWSECASDNLSLLSHVTSHTPRDEITTYSELRRLKEEYLHKTPKEREASMNEPELLKGMHGQLVKYPPKFLSSQEKKSVTMKLSQTFDLAKAQCL